MTDATKRRWMEPDADGWETKNLEAVRYGDQVWVTAWDNDELGNVFMFTPTQAREIAAHLTAIANEIEGEARD